MQRAPFVFVVLSFALSICLFRNVASAAQTTYAPTITWEDLCAVSVCRGTGHDGVFSASFSPNGKQLLTHVLHPEKSGLYIVELDGSAQFLTEGSSASWIPNSTNVLYSFDNTLWLIDTQSKQKRKLLKGWSGIRSPKVSPDGNWVVFSNARSGHQDLWLIPTDGSTSPVQLTQKSMPNNELRLGYSWSPDSKHIAYFSNRADYWSDDLWLVDITDKNSVQLTDTLMGRGEPAWSPDGSQIAMYGSTKSDYWYTELADIFILTVKNKTTQKLTKQVTAREPGSPRWSQDGKQLFFPNHSRGVVELWAVPSQGGVATRLTHQKGLIHTWDMSPDGSALALVRSTPTRGREVDIQSSLGGQHQRLTQFSTDWQGLVEPQEISYRSIDGMYIQGFMFLPPHFSKENTYPAIVQVHGGGTHSYYNGLNLVEQRLAQLGYVVIAVNYRGGSGFGRSFQDLSTNDWANTQTLDAAAAADFIRKQSWSNQKVGIYGYSYGGITSLGAVARAPDAFDAAVPMAGIYDFATAYDNENRVIELFIKYGHSGEPNEQPEHYGISNTITRLKDVKTPILLMHGEADTIAPFNQFIQAVEVLKRHNKVFEAHSYPNEPHRFRNPANRVDMYKKLEAWMARWLED